MISPPHLDRLSRKGEKRKGTRAVSTLIPLPNRFYTVYFWDRYAFHLS
jgi:hypothetical protein